MVRFYSDLGILYIMEHVGELGLSEWRWTDHTNRCTASGNEFYFISSVTPFDLSNISAREISPQRPISFPSRRKFALVSIVVRSSVIGWLKKIISLGVSRFRTTGFTTKTQAVNCSYNSYRILIFCDDCMSCIKSWAWKNKGVWQRQSNLCRAPPWQRLHMWLGKTSVWTYLNHISMLSYFSLSIHISWIVLKSVLKFIEFWPTRPEIPTKICSLAAWQPESLQNSAAVLVKTTCFSPRSYNS